MQSGDASFTCRCSRHTDVQSTFLNHGWQADCSDGGVAQVVHELVAPRRKEVAKHHKLLDERFRRAQKRRQVT